MRTKDLIAATSPFYICCPRLPGNPTWCKNVVFERYSSAFSRLLFCIPELTFLPSQNGLCTTNYYHNADYQWTLIHFPASLSYILTQLNRASKPFKFSCLRGSSSTVILSAWSVNDAFYQIWILLKSVHTTLCLYGTNPYGVRSHLEIFLTLVRDWNRASTQLICASQETHELVCSYGNILA